MNIIQIDSREKNNKHILDTFEMYSDLKLLTSKLPYGDYCNFNNAFCVIERKNSINELATCLGKEHERFKKELSEARSFGIHIIILIEESKEFINFEDIKNWVNPKLKKYPKAMTGEKMYKILSKYIEWYGIEVKFTTKDYVGFDIVELLNLQ